MSIESKIRWKALLLYIVMGLSIAIITILFYGLQTRMNSERTKISQQRNSLQSIHKLISTVNNAQQTANLYITSRNLMYLVQFDSTIKKVDRLTRTLKSDNPSEATLLNQTTKLLKRQSDNLRLLNNSFLNENPLTRINQRLSTYQPPSPVETHTIATRQDTTVKVLRKKGFFRRLKEVFSPEHDSTVIINNEQVIKLKTADSLAIITQVKDIAQKERTNYDNNIRHIEMRVANLINADREISSRLSHILMNLYEKSYRNIMSNITNLDASVNRNYFFSLCIAAVALALMLLFIILIIFDVNKGKRAREQINELMESRHQLLLAVSHDIKSPLHSISGYLELQQDSNEKQAMQNATRHISALLENLLEFSSLEQGTLAVTVGTIDLHRLCNELEQMFRPMADNKKLALECHANPVRIRTDVMKLKQIAINLISNAIKYTREGCIHVFFEHNEGILTLNVTDTGVGIPEDKIQDLFKPFVRIERNNAMAHGTGLGMFVVKGLVELLNGTIQVESTTGVGTCFHLNIPAETCTTELPKGAKKVALYDDDPVMLGIVRDMLLRLGHSVVDKNFDFILTDMEMNELSGLDILASAGNIPVIVMTGRSDFTYEKARELGFTDYLAKPFGLESLRMIFGEGEVGFDDFLGDDEEEIRELFRQTTAENFSLLKTALDNNDFNTAQHLCHKMLPMFSLLGYPTEALRRMDLHKSKEYAEWKSDTTSILTIKV